MMAWRTALAIGFALLLAGGAIGQRLDPSVEPALPEAALPSPVQDYVITAGRLKEGRLLACTGESCTIEGASVPVAETVFVGLAVEAPAPPALQDYMQDQVVLRDGTTQPGRMVGISDDRVTTDRGSFAREEVAWLYLLPPQPETAQPDGFGAPEDAPPDQADEPTVEPPGSEDQTSVREQPPGGPASGEVGALWTGIIESEWTHSDDVGRIHWTGTMENLRLREHIFPILAWTGQESRRIGSQIGLFVEGSSVSSTFSSVVPACTQSGSGVGTLDGQEDSAGSVIWKKFGDVDTTATIGWNIPEGPGMYVLSVGPVTGQVSDKYPTSGCEPLDNAFPGAVIGNYPPPMPSVNDFDSVVRILEGGGRMSGSYTATMSDGQLRVSWNICREGVSCAAPPSEEPPGPTAGDDACEKPTTQQALLENALARRKLLSDRLAKQFDAYQRLLAQAAQWQNDFDQATRDCGLWTAARILANFLLSNYSPTSAARFGPSPVPPASGVLPPSSYKLEPGKELVNFLSLIEKIADGDPSWMLPNTEDPWKEWLSLEDAWEGFQAGYGKLLPDSDPEALLSGLRSCGAPTINAVMDGAVNYLRLLQQIEPMMRDVWETSNRLRDLDEDELFKKWSDYQRACLEHAACAGLDPTICDHPAQ